MGLFGKKNDTGLVKFAISNYCEERGIKYQIDGDNIGIFTHIVYRMQKDPFMIMIYNSKKEVICAFQLYGGEFGEDYKNVLAHTKQINSAISPFELSDESESRALVLARKDIDFGKKDISVNEIDSIISLAFEKYAAALDVMGDVLVIPRLYSGETSVNSKGETVANGTGRMDYSGGSYYIGSWSDGVKNGQGEDHYSNGSYSISNWVNGKKQGNGVIHRRNGTCETGTFVDDYLSGFVKVTVEKKVPGEISDRFDVGDTIYEGNFIDGNIGGQGRLYAKFLNEPGYFEGKWEDLNNMVGRYVDGNGGDMPVVIKDGEIIPQ